MGRVWDQLPTSTSPRRAGQEERKRTDWRSSSPKSHSTGRSPGERYCGEECCFFYIWYIFCWWGFLSHSCRIGLHFQNKLSLISQYWAFNDGEFAVHFHNHVDVETDFVDVLFRWWSPLPGDFFGILYPLSLAALQKSLNLRFRSRRTVYGRARGAKKMGIKAG